jgi:hypothetical protein
MLRAVEDELTWANLICSQNIKSNKWSCVDLGAYEVLYYQKSMWSLQDQLTDSVRSSVVASNYSMYQQV